MKAGLETGDVIILLHEVRQDRALDFLFSREYILDQDRMGVYRDCCTGEALGSSSS